MQRENWQPHDTNTNRNLVPVYTIQGLLYIANNDLICYYYIIIRCFLYSQKY